MINYTTLLLAAILLIPTFIVVGLVYYTNVTLWYLGCSACLQAMCYAVVMSPDAKGRTGIGRSWNEFKTRYIVSN